MNKNSKGITLVALVITITVLLIIAGISVYNGKETIGKAKLEELKTNGFLRRKSNKNYRDKKYYLRRTRKTRIGN